MVGIWTSSLGMLELSEYVLHSAPSCESQRAMMRLRGVRLHDLGRILDTEVDEIMDVSKSKFSTARLARPSSLEVRPPVCLSTKSGLLTGFLLIRMVQLFSMAKAASCIVSEPSVHESIDHCDSHTLYLAEKISPAPSETFATAFPLSYPLSADEGLKMR